MESSISIIIANYNNEEWVRKGIESIIEQTYENWELIIVDDLSSDGSVDIIKGYKDNRIIFYENIEKRWNGGSRNVGLDIASGDYVLFMDNDDWLDNRSCLKHIRDSIVENNYPDVVRLPYRVFKNGEKNNPIMLSDDTPEKLCNSKFVAPWTKLVKREKVVKFPENTLIEDVVQHIAQCDVIDTVGVCRYPIINWNRDNVNSTSLSRNLHKHNSKRVSSVFRNIADLMDLVCTHDYCEKQRLWRLDAYKNLVRQGKEEEFF